VATQESRLSLHQEVLRRRKSLTSSELNFLQGIIANGTEVEVQLVQRKLTDPSLCFDVDDDDDNDIEEEQEEDDDVPISNIKSRHHTGHATNTDLDVTNHTNNTTASPRDDNSSHASSRHLHVEEKKEEELPKIVLGPSRSDSVEDDMDASIDTCDSNPMGKPPVTPIPISPRQTWRTLHTPSKEELYPEQVTTTTPTADGVEVEEQPEELHDEAGGLMMPTLPYNLDLEQTPQIGNLGGRMSKSLTGAATLPSLLQQPQLTDSSSQELITNTNAAALRPVVLERRSSNPFVNQLWKAHEQGLSVSSHSSFKRIERMRHEKYLPAHLVHSPANAASSVRRYSSSTSGNSMSQHSLLTPQELQRIKQRSNTSARWAQYFLQQNASDEDNASYHPHAELQSLLLPTDEDIVRRATDLQQQQLQTPVHRNRGGVPDRPPAPRSFGNATTSSNNDNKSTTATDEDSKPPPKISLQRRASDGVPILPPPVLQRRPSALRRLTSDGSGPVRRKSVSFSMQVTADDDQQPLAKSSGVTSPPTIGEDLGLDLSASNDTADDSLLSFASGDHPVIPTTAPCQREVSGLTLDGLSLGGGGDDSWDPEAEASLNIHHARALQNQESIISTTDGWEAARAFSEQVNQQQQKEEYDKATPLVLTSPVSVPSLNLHRAHTLRSESGISSPTNDGSASVASLNLHRARPVRSESESGVSPTSTSNSVFNQKSSWGRMDSLNSVASLNLHPARPVRQDSIASTAEGMLAARAFQEELDATTDLPSPPSLAESSSSPLGSESFFFATPRNPQKASPIRQDSVATEASRGLHKARPVRQDSIASTAGGAEALRAFQEQFDTGSDFYFSNNNDDDGAYSLASLNLDMATPIKESIFQRRESMASVAYGGAQLNTEQAFRRRDSMNSAASMDLHHAHPIRQEMPSSQIADQWLRRDSMASVASLNLHRAHPIRQDSIASTATGLNTMDAFRERVAMESWGRRDSMASVASLNLHRAHPIRRDSIASTATGADATNALREQFEVEPNTAIKPAWGRRESMESVASLKLRHGHAVASKNEIIDILRNQGSAFAEEDLMAASMRSLSVADPSMTSMNSIPSLHPAFPIRQDSIASCAAGRAARENLCNNLGKASVVASEWESNNIVSQQPVLNVTGRDVPRPVYMRHASASEYDEEGMEVAPLEEEIPEVKLKTQIVVPDRQFEMSAVDVIVEHRHPAAPKQHSQNIYRKVPSNNASRSLHSIDTAASFDESKSLNRLRGVFRGELPRSISDDDLSIIVYAPLSTYRSLGSGHACLSYYLLTSDFFHSKLTSEPQPLKRGQSDATVYSSHLNSESWELDTVVGDYDAWNAVNDDYINGYGGGGTLPFRILGTDASDMNAQPHVLSPPLMESLQSFFPTSISQDNFWMKYSMVRDGSSLHSLMQNARGAKYSILAIETTDGEGTYSVFCQSTFPDNNIRRHTIF